MLRPRTLTLPAVRFFICLALLALFACDGAAQVSPLPGNDVAAIYEHEVGDLDGLPYFTMEYLEGGSLAGKLAGFVRRRLPGLRRNVGILDRCFRC